MVVIGWVEGGGVSDLCDDGTLHLAGLLNLLFDLFGLLLLFVTVVEDGRAILGTHVVALGIQGGRIVDAEEEANQVLVRDDIGFIQQSEDFSMASHSSAHLLQSERVVSTPEWMKEDAERRRQTKKRTSYDGLSAVPPK